MTKFPTEPTPGDRWRGPEWLRHIAGKAMAERRSARVALSWKDELALLFPPH